MVHKSYDEDFCVARPIYNAKGKAFHQSAAGAFERGRATAWIGGRVSYRAFESMFKPDTQSITNPRVVGNFLQ
jgi:hypothetical protein